MGCYCSVIRIRSFSRAA
uniref:Uncharacterized protein n=1 Tax=Anguilla anguilla TaxID=7936 RepID=A0A0E9U2T3_ANGAN